MNPVCMYVWLLAEFQVVHDFDRWERICLAAQKEYGELWHHTIGDYLCYQAQRQVYAKSFEAAFGYNPN